ncbi:hypothetical protein J437_LFUL007112 [Ladona fulva]|uniref:Glutathione peroxidase n=1 Tax=Ladona fulva TaxID=123851 RepID=A0A8K0P0N0_LADFU|nr:hypothetical protein J437_LFUL007112 [Ladona fulva]
MIISTGSGSTFKCFHFARHIRLGLKVHCISSVIYAEMLISGSTLLRTTVAALGLITTSAKFGTMAQSEDWKNAKTIYDFTVKDIKGNEVSLEKYRGHVAIIVNVASQCGLTATNYKELQELYEKYGESKGLKILAFPCNQFAGQEPGNSEEIVCFAAERNVTFDMFEKGNVNGDNAHPLWKFLKHKQGGLLMDMIKWNFTKFIIDKEGNPVERHGPNVDPLKLVSSLEKYW